MGLFGRKRAKDETERPVAETGADGIPASLPSDAEATAATVAESDDWEPETPFSRLRGPFDRAEVTRDDTRVELGSLWVAITDGVQVALQVRAVSPGKYVLPQAYVEDMYNPSRYGRTGTGSVEVRAAK